MNYLGIDYGEVNYGFAIGNSITKNSTTYFSEKIASEKEALKFKLYLQNKIYGKILGPVSAPIFRLKRKYRVRLLIRGPKTLKLQNSLSSTISKYKIFRKYLHKRFIQPFVFRR